MVPSRVGFVVLGKFCFMSVLGFFSYNALMHCKYWYLPFAEAGDLI